MIAYLRNSKAMTLTAVVRGSGEHLTLFANGSSLEDSALSLLLNASWLERTGVILPIRETLSIGVRDELDSLVSGGGRSNE